MQFSTVSAWLEWMARIHFQEIDLGLERVKQAAKRLNILTLSCPIIIVGGTNGKGSTVAALEAIYLSAGYQVGTFTSPFLFCINEEIKINATPVNDQELIAAFSAIETAREDISLTSFEFLTLAAIWIFHTHPLDIWILEVGLGGRLDAVNILDADVSVITRIDIDHADLLGHTREAIGYEKAGIARANKYLVCGDTNPPVSIKNHAKVIGARDYYQGRDFSYMKQDSSWSWQSQNNYYDHLPYNQLNIQNLSTALMAVNLLKNKLSIDVDNIRDAFKDLHLPGRIQVIVKNNIKHIYDVSHNPAAIAYLAERLALDPADKPRDDVGVREQLRDEGEVSQQPRDEVGMSEQLLESDVHILSSSSRGLSAGSRRKNIAIFSMLADKDILQSILAIAPQIDHWVVAPLKAKRAANLDQLRENFKAANITHIQFFSSIPEAYQEALKIADEQDQLIIFGSFHTVSEVQLLG